MLIVHGWTGVGPNVRIHAQLLARLGYGALAACREPMKCYADVRVRGWVRAGFDRLVADPRVDPERIAVMGYCSGGSTTLELARTGAPVRDMISFHHGLIAHYPRDASAIVLTCAAAPAVPDSAADAFKDELRALPELD